MMRVSVKFMNSRERDYKEPPWVPGETVFLEWSVWQQTVPVSFIKLQCRGYVCSFVPIPTALNPFFLIVKWGVAISTCMTKC